MRNRRFVLLAFLATLCASPVHTAPASLEARWKGFIAADGDTVEWSADIARMGRHGWAGEMDIPAQGLSDFPLGVDLFGDTLVLSIGFRDMGVGAAGFRGVLNAAGDTLSGMLVQGSRTNAFMLVRQGKANVSASLRQLLDRAPDSLVVHDLSPDARELKRRFNDDAGHVRLLMLMSPT